MPMLVKESKQWLDFGSARLVFSSFIVGFARSRLGGGVGWGGGAVFAFRFALVSPPPPPSSHLAPRDARGRPPGASYGGLGLDVADPDPGGSHELPLYYEVLEGLGVAAEDFAEGGGKKTTTTKGRTTKTRSEVGWRVGWGVGWRVGWVVGWVSHLTVRPLRFPPQQISTPPPPSPLSSHLNVSPPPSQTSWLGGGNLLL